MNVPAQQPSSMVDGSAVSAERMTKLGTAITEAIVHTTAFQPFFHVSVIHFGSRQMGRLMAWIGIRRVSPLRYGALKRGFAPRAHDWGYTSAGGAERTLETRHRNCG